MIDTLDLELTEKQAKLLLHAIPSSGTASSVHFHELCDLFCYKVHTSLQRTPTSLSVGREEYTDNYKLDHEKVCILLLV